MTKSETANALANVITFLGKDKTSTVQKSNSVVPTSKVRSQINLLANSTPESFVDNQINLRTVAEGLFNWSGGASKVNKNVVREMSKALTMPGKYSVAVELSAYLAAWAPLLEPDRIARLFSLVEKTDTAYGPALYTLQLHQRLEKIFGQFSPERQETLASSLWVEAHKGRWWDITAGSNQAVLENRVLMELADDTTPETPKQLVENIISGTQVWSPKLNEKLQTLPPNSELLNVIEQYSVKLVKGEAVDPDLAVISSHIPWVPSSKRPESPIGSLLNELVSLRNKFTWDAPSKPKNFSDLFPPVTLWGGNGFPFADNILQTDGISLNGVMFELVHNATELAANRDYMGNCTWSYKGQMEKGEYVLYRLHYRGSLYNAAMIAQGARKKKWVFRELNSRFNRGGVPAEVRTIFSRFLEKVHYDEHQTAARVELFQAINHKQERNPKVHKPEYYFQL